MESQTVHLDQIISGVFFKPFLNLETLADKCNTSDLIFINSLDFF